MCLSSHRKMREIMDEILTLHMRFGRRKRCENRLRIPPTPTPAEIIMSTSLFAAKVNVTIRRRANALGARVGGWSSSGFNLEFEFGPWGSIQLT